METGSVGKGGFGPPKAIQSANETPNINPESAPYNNRANQKTNVFDSLEKRTISLGIEENMPSEKSPKRGPPTTPNMVNEACRTPPKNWARKAMARLTMP